MKSVLLRLLVAIGIAILAAAYTFSKPYKMKQLTVYTLTLLFGVALFFSCKKDKPEKDLITVSCDHRTNKLEEVRHLIAGKYEWAYTREVIRLMPTQIYTPTSTGTTNYYIFDTQGYVKYFENNKLVWERRYEVDYELRVTNFPTDSSAVVILKDKETNQRIYDFRTYLCNDSALFFRPSSIDYFKYYKRERL